MEKRDEVGSSAIGSRRSGLTKSFKLAIGSLLTACSKQEICKAFENFSANEQEYLHRLLIQVIASLHGNIEEEFESLCLETQVGTALDTVEQLVEEQALDPLLSDKTNVVDVAQNVLTIKENEIQHLENMLQMAEEQNHSIRACIEVLKKEQVDISGVADAVEKLRRGSLYHGQPASNGINNP
ncbi:Polyamine-modulated factor 1/Kinetochore protein NNF [Trema orientale]|uniref:Polyamine-modulated factor 1/Kinetochore protein NNF n=1 Tax=Trema orientale TaxID=63057 RepID=A0A2P5EKT3_TREOI|nr:Polyamine-modulated factor 1/Kinetochore protein NNF [Trema orientale]